MAGSNEAAIAASQSNPEALAEVLKASMIAGAGGVVASAIIRALRERGDAAKRRKLFQAFVESDSPVIRADPSISDTAVEEGYMHIGDEVPDQLSKVAADTGQSAIDSLLNRQTTRTEPGIVSDTLMAPARVGIEMGGSAIKSLAERMPGVAMVSNYMSDTTKREWTAPAVIAAALASAYGGYKGLDWLMDKIEADDSGDDYARKKNLYQKHVAEALRNKFGSEKTANILVEAARVSGLPFEPLEQSVLEDIKADIESGAMQKSAFGETESERLMGSAALLSMMGLGGLSFVMSKRYFDKKNESRQRYKQLEREVRQKYLYDQSPIMIEADMGFLDDGWGDEGVAETQKRKKAEAVRTTVPQAKAIEGELAGLLDDPVGSAEHEKLKAMAKIEDTTPILAQRGV